MRILHVTREHLADRRYGLGRSLMPVVEAFRDRGIESRYLCQHDLPVRWLSWRTLWLDRLATLPGVCHHLGRRLMLGAWMERLQMGWLAAQLARQEGYSHVHLHDPWLATGFRAGLRYFRPQGVRWGVTEHGFGSYSRATHDDGLYQGARAQHLFRRIESATLAAADWVVAPTRLALDALVRDLCLPTTPEHWKVIPHARPTIARMSRDEARLQLGWPADCQMVLGVGRLVPLKRFDLLLDACISLARTFPNLHLQLLGDGDHARLRQRALAAGFGERLHIDSTESIAPYLRAADIYVSTSSTESFGLANLEALAAGLPAICTAVGGVPEVVGDGGCLIPVEYEPLCSTLRRLLDSPDLRKSLSERGLMRANRWLDLSGVVDAYLAVYQSQPTFARH